MNVKGKDEIKNNTAKKWRRIMSCIKRGEEGRKVEKSHPAGEAQLKPV
jgi:hypothetical protein